MYCQNLLELALVLAEHDPTYEDLATKFFEHFALIASALNARGLWDEEDGFYYDVLRLHGRRTDAARARARSSGCCRSPRSRRIGPETMARLPDFHTRVEWFMREPARGRGRRAAHGLATSTPAGGCSRSSTRTRLRRLLAAMLDPDEFLSDHGIRALSRSGISSIRCSSTSTASSDARLRAGRVDERRSSAATRTGAGRSGSRSTTS